MNIDEIKSVVRPLTVFVYNGAADNIESLYITSDLSDMNNVLNLTKEEFYRTETENDDDGDYAEMTPYDLWLDRECKLVGFAVGHVPSVISLSGLSEEQLAFSIAYQIGSEKYESSTKK